MPRDEGIDKPTQAQPQRGRGYTPPSPPAWKNKPTRKQKDDEAGNDPQPTQPTRYNPTGIPAQAPEINKKQGFYLYRSGEDPLQPASGPQYVPPGLSQPQRPTTTAHFTQPKWWDTLSNNVSNWIDNNVSGSQYVPAGLSQPQRPTTAAQFRPPVWGGNPMQVSEPSDPTLPTGTFFAGGSTQDGTRLVPTGQNTSLLLGGGGIRNQGTVRVARGLPMIGTPSQPSTTANNGGGWGTTYKKKGKGGGGYGGYSYDTKAYSSDRVPSWLMNLTNWNFKG